MHITEGFGHPASYQQIGNRNQIASAPAGIGDDHSDQTDRRKRVHRNIAENPYIAEKLQPCELIRVAAISPTTEEL